ncbi:Ubiquitin-like protein ATG12 [Mycena kentingensis (nom. inval.)]|nr:Ubiquitin-like protein ATG12 [Mycena kentingensis (nom. inval.)]
MADIEPVSKQWAPDINPDALAALETYKKRDPSKVVVRFKAVGNAPIMKQNFYKITASNRFQAVIQFLRKELGWKAGDPLFTYINLAFSPAPDDTVSNLFKYYRCLGLGYHRPCTSLKSNPLRNIPHPHLPEITFAPHPVLLINGPNLNLLGIREPQTNCISVAEQAGASLVAFQSNHEGAILDRIHAARTEGVDAIVINAGAYTHTSVAIRDALLGVAIPFVEIHITNVHTREKFRQHSYLSDKAAAVIVGCGVKDYEFSRFSTL